MKRILIFVLATVVSIQFVFSQPQSPERGFISKFQATTWEEGLLSGNGTIGANVFGNPTHETIIFTHERMFLPQGEPVIPPDQSANLFEIRRLIEEGNYYEATELQFKYSGQEGFMYPDPFVPVCDMNIDMHSKGNIKDYVRSLNFENGESTVFWSDDNGSYERKLFVSRADGIAVLKIRSYKAGGLNCEIQFNRRTLSDKLPYVYLQGSYMVAAEFIDNVSFQGMGIKKPPYAFATELYPLFTENVQMKAWDNFIYYGHSFTKAYPGSIQSVEGLASIKVKGGTYHMNGSRCIIENCNEAVVFIDIEPNYSEKSSAHPWIQPDKFYSEKSSNVEAMKKKLSGISYSYDELLSRHTAIHGELFNRIRLDIGGGSDHSLTTEELFAKSTYQDINRALLEKEFDAGRYNIISSTGNLPPVAQGLWAGTFVPDWASVYTHNGNAPSAISSMLMANNPELMLSYTSYIESLVPYFEINAKHLFGCRGIVLPSYTATNGYNNALEWDFAGGFWIAGAAWAAHFFYDYYQYTGDKEFLRNHALPFMEKAALFFEDFLYLGSDGKYIFSPTQSPENIPGNSNSQGSFNATMAVAAAKELFTNTIAASKLLKVNSDKISLWEDMLTKIPDYMIDENGMFKEWLTPKLTNNDDHRHSSQFYPLYDNFPLEFAQNPALVEAVRRSANFKLEKHWKGSGAGFMSFGLVQLGLVGATIGDKEIVHETLRHLVNGFWLNNMASTHNYKSLLNMDISGGMTAVIIKMLVYSDPGLIKILPALPDVWQEGTIEGVLCRGQVLVDKLSWTADSAEATLISKVDQKITLQCGTNKKLVSLKANKPQTIKVKR